MQMELQECGAACLAMILAYYGKWLPLAQVREDCGVSRDGASSDNIMQAAHKYGLAAKCEWLKDGELDGSPLPCVIHWRHSHFVVFRGFRHRYAYINDPALGAMRISFDEFKKSFSGTALFFKPGPEFQPEGKRPSVLAFVRSRMRGMLAPFIFVLLASLLTALIGVVQPVFLRAFIDKVLSASNASFLPFLLEAMAGAALFAFGVSVVQELYLLKIEGRFAVNANAGFLQHVFSLPLAFFQHRMAGDIADRQNINQDIAAALLRTLTPQMLNMIMLVCYLAVMLDYSIPLSAIGVGAALVNAGLSVLISKQRIAAAQVQAREQGALIGMTMAGVNMIETIKSSGAEKKFFEKWANSQAAVNASEVRFIKVNQVVGRLPEFVRNLSGFAILGLGVMLILRGRFSAGMLMAFQGFLSSFNAPVMSLIQAGQRIQEMRTNMERVEDVMSYKVQENLTAKRTNHANEKRNSAADYTDLHRLEPQALSIKDISFGYSKLSPPFIENFDLELKAGKSAALVGPTGCGKSTIVALIAGLYKPWSGTLAIKAAPAAVVDQHIVLFSGTIRDNIKLWDESISDEAMVQAAKDAHLHDAIMRREKGTIM
jgi:ABC-type bacteriocin/lantibiotic exporter with double-glycine peptidase domain